MKKRVSYGYLRKGWNQWEMFGSISILNELNDHLSKKRAFERYDYKPIRVKITIEEVKK